MVKIDERKMNKMYSELKQMREVAHKVDFEKSKEIRKEQQKLYDKYVFIRKLQREMEVANSGK